MKIGVFDSGIGGKSVADAIESAMTEHEVVFKDDSENMPYGNKEPEEIYKLALPKLQTLADNVDIIVVACNTLTTLFLDDFKRELPVPVIGVAPMLKEAVRLSKKHKIGVFATPATFASSGYKSLKAKYTKDIEVLEPDCSKWAYYIEQNKRSNADISETVHDVLVCGADVLVLACTHYHWIEESILEEAKKFNATVIQPESLTIERVRQEIARLS